MILILLGIVFTIIIFFYLSHNGVFKPGSRDFLKLGGSGSGSSSSSGSSGSSSSGSGSGSGSGSSASGSAIKLVVNPVTHTSSTTTTTTVTRPAGSSSGSGSSGSSQYVLNTGPGSHTRLQTLGVHQVPQPRDPKYLEVKSAPGAPMETNQSCKSKNDCNCPRYKPFSHCVNSLCYCLPSAGLDGLPADIKTPSSPTLYRTTGPAQRSKVFTIVDPPRTISKASMDSIKPSKIPCDLKDGIFRNKACKSLQCPHPKEETWCRAPGNGKKTFCECAHRLVTSVII